MLKEVNKVFDVMIQRGVEPDTITYNSLIDSYCLQNRMDEAVKAFNTMVEKVENSFLVWNFGRIMFIHASTG
jgi:pentatricopeptide repeat protein